MTAVQQPLVLDPDALAELLEDLGGDAATVMRFVEDFVGLWPSRISRLHSAASTADLEALDEVLLSMRCPAQMLGATQLAELAESVRLDLAAGAITVAAVPLGIFDELGAASCAALAELPLSRAATV